MEKNESTEIETALGLIDILAFIVRRWKLLAFAPIALTLVFGAAYFFAGDFNAQGKTLTKISCDYALAPEYQGFLETKGDSFLAIVNKLFNDPAILSNAIKVSGIGSVSASIGTAYAVEEKDGGIVVSYVDSIDEEKGKAFAAALAKGVNTACEDFAVKAANLFVAGYELVIKGEVDDNSAKLGLVTDIAKIAESAKDYFFAKGFIEKPDQEIVALVGSPRFSQQSQGGSLSAFVKNLVLAYFVALFLVALFCLLLNYVERVKGDDAMRAKLAAAIEASRKKRK